MMEAELKFEELIARAQEELLAQRRTERAKSREGIPERTLAWLALPPVWTLKLAEACSFPTISGSGVRETLQRLYKEKLCDYIAASEKLIIDESAETTASESERYIIGNAARVDIFQRIVRDPKKGLPWLQHEMQQIGTAMLEARSSGIRVLAHLERWARLASKAEDPKALVREFTAEIEHLLQAKESGEVLRWIESARPLEELLGGELTTALRQASRRLDLFRRRADDERYLAHFVVRDYQINAFKALLTGSNDLWGLHYIGDGGIGKTMLARYIGSHLASELNISVARIDFDYLNPEYPPRQPGLLLQELALELRLQDEGDETETIVRLFERFDQKVVSLHESLSAFPNDLSALLRTLASMVEGVVQAFATAAAALPKQPVRAAGVQTSGGTHHAPISVCTKYVVSLAIPLNAFCWTSSSCPLDSSILFCDGALIPRTRAFSSGKGQKINRRKRIATIPLTWLCTLRGPKKNQGSSLR